MDNYIAPEVRKSAFHCPFCGTYAKQSWKKLLTSLESGRTKNQIGDGNVGYCAHCRDYHIWMGDELIYPATSSAPKPEEDMPEEVAEDFREARRVVDDSPKAAAALLRLAMEKLTQDLTGNEDGDLYSNIGELVEDGRIDERVQKALDTVRVTGNDYVHAGEIYSPDDRETALRLFELVNTIVRLTITQERLVEEAWSEVPERKKEGVEQRDSP